MSGPLHGDDERAVAEANAGFYSAFEQKSVVAMGEVWAAASPVSCIHPGWAVLVGRDTVLESWRQIFESTVSARCRIRRPRIFVAGDVGWVVLVEELALVQASGVLTIVGKRGNSVKPSGEEFVRSPVVHR